MNSDGTAINCSIDCTVQKHLQDIKTTGENCTGKSKLISEVRHMCYAISRGKNSKKTYLKQLELISNFNGSSKAKNQPSNLLILNSLVKILSNYFVGRCCTIDKNVSGVSPNGKEPQVDFCPGPPNFSERPCHSL